MKGFCSFERKSEAPKKKPEPKQLKLQGGPFDFATATPVGREQPAAVAGVAAAAAASVVAQQALASVRSMGNRLRG